MSLKRTPWLDEWALMLALLLLVQALLVGLATGARADPSLSGLTIICGNSLSRASDGGRGAAGHYPDCCDLACPMAGATLPPPALTTLGLTRAFLLADIGPRPTVVRPERAELAPVLSRAPPIAP